MSYTRDAGTTTATYAGYCSWGGLPINDGTFKSTSLPMLNSQPPIRDAGESLPSDDGGLAGFPLLDRWEFDLEGFLWVPSGLTDMWAAVSDLKSVFNLYAGTQELTFKALDFADARQMLARVSGAVQIVEPAVDLKKIPRRDFVIPMVAEDPRAYNAVSSHSVTIAVGGSSNLTNSGDYPTPFSVQFVGPLTNPFIDGPGPTLLNRIRLANADATDYVIASGHSVTVQTNPSDPAGITALDDTGASVYAKVANRSASVIIPGTNSWSLTASAGTGHALVTFRDAWA